MRLNEFEVFNIFETDWNEIAVDLAWILSKVLDIKSSKKTYTKNQLVFFAFNEMEVEKFKYKICLNGFCILCHSLSIVFIVQSTLK